MYACTTVNDASARCCKFKYDFELVFTISCILIIPASSFLCQGYELIGELLISRTLWIDSAILDILFALCEGRDLIRMIRLAPSRGENEESKQSESMHTGILVALLE